MEKLMQRRGEVLARVHELRGSQVKPQDNGEKLDRDLAALHPTLPLKWLTSSLFATGTAFVGFLYNTGFSCYVSADGDDKWLFAAKSTTDGAVRWTLYKDSVGNLVINATIGGATFFFNWRNTTGACKLYDSYDKMTAQTWVQSGVFDGDTFQMQNADNKQLIGAWSNSDNELYNRTNIVRREFGFQFFDKEAFSADDKLIYSAFMKENGSIH
ncbi:hypothetical protein MTP10_03710 [Nonomuraea sp. 3-1Str]|uniref:hypothetical protein n=1 Tax=Nonomuraea sp. 3-1Str TaxID=2929801 RepID=UPI00285AB959|nr:hypothetical protein [Nonomuraea sp. 3-1Str]MDR8407841.1 hypothetical protein [Nonomuraea sp. 3-1Str]